MEIVALTPEDWRVFREVRLEALAEAAFAFASTREGEERHDEAVWRARLAARMQFVARDEAGAVIGTAGGFRDGPAMELISMWVAPQVRGRGVGEALVRRVIELGREMGSREVLLEVSEDNLGAARLYERCGFRRTGARGPIRPGEARMRVEMRLMLTGVAGH